MIPINTIVTDKYYQFKINDNISYHVAKKDLCSNRVFDYQWVLVTIDSQHPCCPKCEYIISYATVKQVLNSILKALHERRKKLEQYLKSSANLGKIAFFDNFDFIEKDIAAVKRLLEETGSIAKCNCCNQVIDNNPIVDKWGVGYICNSCQSQEN